MKGSTGIPSRGRTNHFELDVGKGWLKNAKWMLERQIKKP